MKIFITGASGFIGSHIVSMLSKQHQFYGMARSEQAAEKVKRLGAIPVICELGEVMKENLAGCEMIIHAAAFTKEWGTKKEFWNTTVAGTEQLLSVAAAIGCEEIYPYQHRSFTVHGPGSE